MRMCVSILAGLLRVTVPVTLLFPCSGSGLTLGFGLKVREAIGIGMTVPRSIW
jgi:hypothetical protein